MRKTQQGILTLLSIVIATFSISYNSSILSDREIGEELREEMERPNV
jgi:hypothetical protein